MVAPRLHDAVSLRHFASVSRLDLIEKAHANFDPPRWVAEVQDEVRRHAGHDAACQTLMGWSWPGAPASPSECEALHVYELQVALNDGQRPPANDKGEAESIFFAHKLGGSFFTDDTNAYDFATRRLGEGRVVDTVWVLQTLVADGALTCREAADIANNISGAGRSFRRGHTAPFKPAQFG